MQTEIEAKWLNINAGELRQKLKGLGGRLVESERMLKRKVFDYPDGKLQKIGGWIRVRDEGNKITLSYKQLNDRTLHGTKEVVVIVEDFDNACDFLVSIGLKTKAYQETKRESWILDGAEVEIDTWPWIPTFVEVEAKEEKLLKGVATQLGLNWPKAMYGGVDAVYPVYYDVTEEEVNAWEEITFTPVPAWLKSKVL